MYAVLVKTNHRPVKAYGPFYTESEALAWKQHHNRTVEGRREYTVLPLNMPINPDHMVRPRPFNPIINEGAL